jgi:hypothetical protein
VRGGSVEMTVVQDTSAVPSRAREAMDLDVLDVWGGAPLDQRINVGLRVQLELVVTGATNITDVEWTLPGSAIASYSNAAALGAGEGYLVDCSTTKHTDEELEESSIAFYFTEEGDVTVSVDAVVDDVPMTFTKMFSVRRHPKAEIFYATGPGTDSALGDLNGDTMIDEADFLLYESMFGHEADPAGTMGPGVLGEHKAWHELHPTQTTGDEFVRFHRAYLQRADCWRGIFGYPCIQVYATAPDAVPAGDDVDHFGTGAGGTCDTGTGTGDGNGIVALQRDVTGYPTIEELPAALTLAGDGSTALGDIASAADLVLAFITYHDTFHANLPGDLQNDCTGPADPLFWRFELGLVKLHELWTFLQLGDGSMEIPAVEATSPDGAAVYFPDPDVTVDTGCEPQVLFACDMPSGSTFPLGTTTVNCTVSDVMLLDPGFGGTNPGTTMDVSFDVTVVDTAAPTITCPEDMTLECTSEDGAIAMFEATAEDTGDADPTIVCTPPSGSVFPLGTTTVECVATDASGNSSSCSFDVTVVDTTPPVITCPDDLTVECAGPDGAVATFDATATDECDEAPVVVCTPASGSLFPLGTTTVECTATDASGNSSTCTFEVSVVDTTPPVITCPDDMTLECTGPDGAVATFAAMATDLCDTDPVVVCTPPSGSTFPLGTTTVECVATDASGNSASCSFVVEVVDTTPPDIVVNPNPTVLWPPNHKYHTIDFTDAVLSISDLCDDTVDIDTGSFSEVSSDEPENAQGSGDGNTIDDILFASGCRSVHLRSERQGKGNGRVYTMTIEASDASGNTATATYQVFVPHDAGKRSAVDDGPAYSESCGSGAQARSAFSGSRD